MAQSVIRYTQAFARHFDQLVARDKPYRVAKVPPVAQRLPVMKDHLGNWIHDKKRQITSRVIKPNREMKEMKARWAQEQRQR